MKKSLKILIAGAILAVALVYGGILLWTKVINKPEERFDTGDLADIVAVTTTFAESLPPSVDEPRSDDELTGMWMSTTGSEVGYRVKEVLGGVDTEGVGRTDDVAGSLTIEGSTIIATTFEVQVATITSDSSRRDSQFAGPIMDTDEFPVATFRLTSPIELGAVPAAGTDINATATGELTLHGVTREVVFQVTARIENGIIGVLGSIDVMFSDYNIDNPSNGFVTTGDTGSIEFVLAFART